MLLPETTFDMNKTHTPRDTENIQTENPLFYDSISAQQACFSNTKPIMNILRLIDSVCQNLIF